MSFVNNLVFFYVTFTNKKEFLTDIITLKLNFFAFDTYIPRIVFIYEYILPKYF